MDLLIIDNYDSFTYNIAHIVRNHPQVKLQIKRANDIAIEEVEQFDKIIFSPGPDLPVKGDAMSRTLEWYSQTKSILGICLGLQAIVIHFGGQLLNLEEVVHGRTKTIYTTDSPSGIFEGVGDKFEAGLYHSWIANPDNMPESLAITAFSKEKRIMAIKHKTLDIEAVQFHPESIMTPSGTRILNNWIEL